MGWDGGRVPDSQHVLPECYYSLGMAVASTTNLRLATVVTNPETRDAAVLASAAAAAQHYSGGRLVLGIGRGDSAVLKIGRRPMSLAQYEAYLQTLQTYLRGEAGALDRDGVPSPIPWIKSAGVPKVPLDVAATGPRMIALGARVAEGVNFALGADVERIRWAVDTARAARFEAGLDPDSLTLSAYVMVGVDENIERARDLVRPTAAIHVRFASVNMGRGRTQDEVPDSDRSTVSSVTNAYRTAGHGLSTGDHVAAIDDEFLDRFAIVGPPSACIDRLLELNELGISRFYIGSPAIDLDKSVWYDYSDRIAKFVLPELRAHRVR